MVGLAPPIPKKDGLKLQLCQNIVFRFVAKLLDGKVSLHNYCCFVEFFMFIFVYLL
jgi:hypothetical protein